MRKQLRNGHIMNKTEFKDALKYGKCVSGYCDNEKKIGLPLHTCPYNEEVHNDIGFQCNCCHNCTTQCASDIQ